MVPVRAEIIQLHNMSAHADAGEVLQWLGYFAQPPRCTFITHGEPRAAAALKVRIEEELGWKAVVPAYLQKEEF